MCSKWKQIELASDNSQGINKITSQPGVAKGHCNKCVGMAEGVRSNCVPPHVGIAHSTHTPKHSERTTRRATAARSFCLKREGKAQGADMHIYSLLPLEGKPYSVCTNTHITVCRRANRIAYGCVATAGWVLSQLFCHDCRNVYCILFNCVVGLFFVEKCLRCVFCIFVCLYECVANISVVKCGVRSVFIFGS